MIVIGDDFRFGKNKSGDSSLIKKLSEILDFKSYIQNDFFLGDQKVSSSLLRNHAGRGNLTRVSELRGSNLIIRGRVIHGKKLGTKLGFPTLNLKVPDNLCFSGIFVIKLTEINFSNVKPQIWGIASLGNRPTIESKGKLLLEVFLLDYSDDKYGSLVTIEFITKLRDEKKFRTIDKMKNQMKKDEILTREFIKING